MKQVNKSANYRVFCPNEFLLPGESCSGVVRNEMRKTAQKVVVGENPHCPLCHAALHIDKATLTKHADKLLQDVLESSDFNSSSYVEVATIRGLGKAAKKLCMWKLLTLHTGKIRGEIIPWSSASKDRYPNICRITFEGVSYLEGKQSVPEHMFLFRGEVLGFSDSTKVFADIDGVENKVIHADL